ncbi:hypothetical protein [Roseococcus sp.]|uniref:hypothetical protein n=1 Tax=Roseococcus sp. TaxID=2109646 RepID=UPI003BAC0A81
MKRLRVIDRRSGTMALLAALLLASACQNDRIGPAAIEGRRPDGRVRMQMVSVAYIGSGSHGTGTLEFHGRSHPFTVTGLGIGGIGASSIEAVGEVYNLQDPSRFAGEYAQARYGFALGQASAGDLWLQNADGVIMRLSAHRTGLMLNLGGDAVVVSMR